MKRAIQFGLLGLLLVVLAGVVAPFIRVDQYREQIRNGLQRALHRKVDIHGDTRLSLFQGPGFSIEGVVIHDDASAGLEPLANVPELQASVRLSSLWTGKLEFSTVRFVEPSLNIVKPDSGVWNVAPLLLGASTQDTVRLPEIRVSGGRLNFKFGNIKSAFYLTNTDLEVSPSRGGLDIRFSAAPARTDRAAQGYGLFTGRGRWQGGQVNLDVELERSSIEELVTLARGQSLGLHGRVASMAKITGPVTNIQIAGRFDLEDVHRWDLIEDRAGRLAMNYRGSLDLGAQRLELIADPIANPGVPVALKLIIGGILYNPNWTVEVALNKLPASAIVEAVRHMGAPLPQGLAIEGNAMGVIAYGSGPGVQGQVDIDDAIVRIDKGPEFRLPHASVVLAGDEIRLLPATLSGQNRTAQLEAVYAPFRQHLEAQISGKGLAIADLHDSPGRLLQGAPVPLLERFRGGTWSGSVAYMATRNEPGEWKADIRIEDTTTSIPGLASPVRLLGADVKLDGERVVVRRLRAATANVEVYGEYSYNPEADRPHQFAFSIPAAVMGDLEQTLAPSLRRSTTFFSRTFRRVPSTPEWMRTRRAEGTLRIGTLTAGDRLFRAVRARVLWTGVNVQLPVLEARLDEAAIRGSAAVDLSRVEPRYKLRGSLTNFEWRGGSADVHAAVETHGTGEEVFENLSASGNYEVRAVLMAPELAVRTASGAFDLSGSRTVPRLKVSVLQATVGAERFAGEGSTQPDGRMHMDLASANRVMRLAGPVMPLKLEITNDRSTR